MGRYVIVDLEMCGVLNKWRRKQCAISCEIIEIGAVLLDETYEIIDRFKTFVSPEYGEIDRFIQNLTGITRAETQNAPTIQEALLSFVSWLPEDAILVSWSDSDEKQIRKEIAAKKLTIPGLDTYLERWEDCQVTFSEKLETRRRYALSEALIIADIGFNENIHDGLVDAENTALLFAKMKREPTLKLSAYFNTLQEEKSGFYTPFSELLTHFSQAV